MKKKLIALCITAILGCQTVCFAAPEQTTEEVDLLSKLNDKDALECIFIGNSLWNDTSEFGNVKENASEILLDYFITEGTANEELTPQDIADLIDSAYEIGWSSDILSISMDMMGEDSQLYRDAILKVFHYQALTTADPDYLLLDTGHFPETALMYKDDWYGDRTDDERIALADSILEILANADVETDGFDGNTLAQALNDMYDQGAKDSVLFLIFSLLDEQDQYITVIDSIITCLDGTFYLTES